MATGNNERIHAELVKAVESIPERYAGYRDGLISAAMDCIATTAEHDDRKTNVNQRFDSFLDGLSKGLAARPAEAQ